MEFTVSNKSLSKWQDMMAELGVESQMREEDLIKKKMKEFAESVKREKAHLEHLAKYHFKSKKEVLDYIYSGSVMIDEDGYDDGFGPDKFKLMEDGSIGHWSLWLSDDDCVVLGTFWRTQSKESFEAWLDKCFNNVDHLDNGYLPVWHKQFNYYKYGIY